jgi:hypothetical protein
MAHYDVQRLKAHWQPNRSTGEGTWQGVKTRKDFTPTAVSLAYLIADALNNKGEEFHLNQKSLAIWAGASKDAITAGLRQLEARGVISRSRARADKATVYRLLIQCPPGCPGIDNHYNPNEFATLPKNQETLSPNNQATLSPNNQAKGLLKTGQLITTNKNLNNKVDNLTPCSSCLALVEPIAGIERTIHSDTCPHLEKLTRGKAWQITSQEQQATWDTLSLAERQRQTWLSLAKGDKRKALAEAQEQETQRAEQAKFERLLAISLGECGETIEALLPGHIKWLRARYRPGSELATNAIKRALHYSKQGRDLKPFGTWERGSWYDERELEGEGD